MRIKSSHGKDLLVGNHLPFLFSFFGAFFPDYCRETSARRVKVIYCGLVSLDRVITNYEMSQLCCK